METINFLNTITNLEIIIIFLIAAAPIGELRLSIPYGLLLTDIPIFNVVFTSIAGNIFSGIFIIHFLPFFLKFFRKIKLINSTYQYVTKRTYSRSYIIQRRKYYGLIFFVSLPLPFTGVWTGSLASNLLGLSKLKSSLAVIIGVLISATVVTTLVSLGMYRFNII